MFMRLDENDNSYGKCNVKKINFDLYKAIVVSDYNKGYLSEEDITYIGKCHDSVFLDTKKILGGWSKSVTYIKININEHERTKHMLDEEISQKLIITMGSAGASHHGVIYPVPEVDIKDLSGAGDTFMAALVKKYINNKNIENAIKYANQCATRVVQQKGVATV
jgi:sugar/nucleoside kinase (ribokinase family)